MKARLAALAFSLALLGAPAHAAQFDLHYNATIMNIVQLGKVTLRGAIAPAGYNAAASIQTSGFARMFDDTRISASSAGAATPRGLSWSSYELSHSYAKKYRRVSMQRNAKGVTATITPNYNEWGSTPASAVQKASAYDPVSAITEMGRAVAASGKCAGAFATFDGKQYYTLTLSPKASGTYNGGGYNGKALICWLRYQPIAGFKPLSAAERAKIPVAEIWFASPARAGFAAPLRIEVPSPVGPARLDLASGLKA